MRGKLGVTGQNGFALSRRSFLSGAAALAFAPRPAWPLALPPRPAFAPKPSDVCFSSRWMRDGALDAARAFGATRLDWCYSSDKPFFDAARAAGLRTIGGALNSTLPDEGSESSYRLGRIKDRNGRNVTAPWMTSWGVVWGCANSPEYRATFLSHARRALEAGADWLVMDGAGMNYTTIPWGGCYCEYCRRKASAENIDLDTQMRRFQKHSVDRFYQDMRLAIDKAAGRHVTLASVGIANPSPHWMAWPHTMFDFSCRELDEGGLDPANLAAKLTAAELGGHPFVISFRSRDVALNKRVLAWCYAHGGHMIAPWDVFLRSTPGSSDRFFGKPRDYAPLYQFARRLGPLLDQAVPAGAGVPGAWTLSRPGVGVALRISAGGGFAILHLVSWQNDGGYTLAIDNAAILPGIRVSQARLLAPQGVDMAFDQKGKGRMMCNIPNVPWAAIEMRLAD